MGPRPRRAPAAAIRTRPEISARRAPRRAISRLPGMAKSASMKGVMPVSTPMAFSFMARSRWISGIRGGTQSTVKRRSAPATHRRTRRLALSRAADGLQRVRILER